MGGEDFLITIPTAIQPVIYGLLENALTEGIAFPPPGQDQHYPVPAVRQVGNGLLAEVLYRMFKTHHCNLKESRLHTIGFLRLLVLESLESC